MYLHDKLWGVVPDVPLVVQDVLATPDMQRLRAVDQSGLPSDFHPRNRYSRHEHSVGVYALLHRLEAPLEEQLAGLIHDASHTACSHLIDWVQGNHHVENFQDARHTDFICKGVIGETLRKHGFSPERLVHYEHFPLLEQPSPIVCADRLDYGMRELHGWAAPALVPGLVNGVGTHSDRIVFDTEQHAYQFGYNFARLQREYWGHAEYMGRYRLLAEALQEGLHRRLISMDDFDGTDDALLGKLLASGQNIPAIQERIDLLREPRIFVYAHPEEERPGKRHLSVKFRSVDPLYLDDSGESRVLSATRPAYTAMLAHDRERTASGIWIRFVRPLPELHKP